MVNPCKNQSLLEALRAALQENASEWSGMPLERLQDKGLAHEHVRLCGTGVLARIPKQSQMQLNAQDNLVYQKACFDRASATGFAPRCLAILPPSVHLPRGALLVQEIVGSPAHLPDDLPAIVESLAVMHAMSLPSQADCKPLVYAPDPLKAMWMEVSEQATYLDAAQVDTQVRKAIATELARLRAACDALHRPSRHLIAFDGHPGNFIVRTRGDGGTQAVLVDLEKCRYSYPGFDLAHATLYTSTTWDVASDAVLSPSQVAQAYAIWGQSVGESIARDALAWHVPLRRAMWLWSITWCAKWKVTSLGVVTPGADGEDWSSDHSNAALVAHVQERVQHYLSLNVVEQMVSEFDALSCVLQ